MPELFLLRHAKSDWGDPDLDDIERPLNARGREAAAAMGREMCRLGLEPALILCSPAARTRETIERAAAECAGLADWRVEPMLYGAGSAEVLEAVRAVDPACPSLMVVGHNPTMHLLALALTDGTTGAARRQLGMKYPTGALAEIELPAWSSARPGAGRLVRFVKPRDL